METETSATTGKTNSASLGQETKDAHHDVIHRVMALEEVLSRSPKPAVEWLAALAQELGELHDLLHAHFDDERQGELYGDLPERFPQYAPSLARLAEEHDELLARTDALLQKVEGLGSNTEVWRLRELNARGQLLAAILRRHEAEENEIVMRAYWDEIGAGD